MAARKTVQRNPEKDRAQKLKRASDKSCRTAASAKVFLRSAGIITKSGKISPIYK